MYRVLVVALLVCNQVAAAPHDDARVLAEVPAALETLHELDNRLGAVEREVARLGAARAADPDIQHAIDALRTEARELERRLAEAQAHAAFERFATSPISYQDGLFLHLPELRLLLNTNVQARYTAVFRQSGGAVLSDFDLHHARLMLAATVVEVAALRAELDFGSAFVGDGKFAPVRDFYAELRPVSFLSLRGGQFKVPFGRQALVDDARLTFVDRSLATRAFTFDRDLGLLVEARLFAERLIMQLSATDGVRASTQSHNDNLDLAYTARVVAQPLGAMPLVEGDRADSREFRFSFGAAVHYDLQPTDRAPPFNDLDHDGRIDNVDVFAFEAEAAAQIRGFAIEGEYFLRREVPGGGIEPTFFQGGYAQASAMLLAPCALARGAFCAGHGRGLQLGARFSYAEPHTIGSSAKVGVVNELIHSGYEIGGVLNWYQWRDNLKAQVEYDFRDGLSIDPRDRQSHRGHVLAVQLQAGF